MFVDRARPIITSGKGGDGAVTLDEPYVQKDAVQMGEAMEAMEVILYFVEADNNLRTLMDFKYKRKYEAENGQNGMQSRNTAKGGEDLEIRVLSWNHDY